MTAAQPGFTAFSATWGRKPSNSYLEGGGNFIDTAGGYQVGQSEKLVGDFIAADRDDLAVALRNNLLESRWQ